MVAADYQLHSAGLGYRDRIGTRSCLANSPSAQTAAVSTISPCPPMPFEIVSMTTSHPSSRSQAVSTACHLSKISKASSPAELMDEAWS